MTVIDTVPDDVLGRIQKLLSLAAKNPNENEAAAATAKAQELLARYNLDAEMMAGAAVGGGAREKAALDGGFYQFERDLWQAVAGLNFCLYWNQRVAIRESKTKVDRYGDGIRRNRRSGYTHRHYLVGKKVNVTATKAMAGYLREVVERLAIERIRGADGLTRYGNWAISYRSGIVSAVRRKLTARRNEALAAEQRARDAAERAAEGASTSTALSLQVYVDKETDANYDFIYGEGWSAKRAAEAAERKRQRDEYTKWAAAHPEEAAAAEAQRARQV